METVSQILEAKGYEGDEIDSIINWANRNKESLDMQTRIEFGVSDHPIHLWEAYYSGDADEEELQKIAEEKGFEDYHELLKAMDRHLLTLAEEYPSKK